MMLTCKYCVKLKACSAKIIGKDCEKNPEYEGERFCPDFKKVLTNADHIRSMTDEELAEVFNYLCVEERICFYCRKTRGCDGECIKGTLDWLKQPYKDNEE